VAKLLDSVILTLRLPLSAAQELRELAALEDRKVGAVARWLIVRALKKLPPQRNP
jgi:hypothetical protein